MSDMKADMEKRIAFIEDRMKDANLALSDVEAELSRLPNPASILAKNDMEGHAWHARLQMVLRIAENGHQAWQHSEHDVKDVLSWAKRDLLKEEK